MVNELIFIEKFSDNGSIEIEYCFRGDFQRLYEILVARVGE